MFTVKRHSDGTLGIYGDDTYRPIVELTDAEIASLAADLCSQLPLRSLVQARAELDSRVSFHESFNRIAVGG